jgi:D-3-phosphoglycerate dehydrogenase / 2-oxoglutarate reductase
MGNARIVMWTEGETGPRFPLDEQGIAAAGGGLRKVACRDEAERTTAAKDAYVLVVAHAQIREPLLAASPGLVGIVRTGIGLDTVDIPGATRQGVCVAHVPDFCYDEVADTAMTLLLAVARKVRLADRHVRGGSWRPSEMLPMRRIRGQTMGLVAFGHIARMVAERARGFGLRLIAFDPYVDAPTMAKLGVEKVNSLAALLEQSDVVSLHTPLTEETRGLMGRPQFAAMKPGAILINTSRGKVVDENALVDALRSGRLGGAGLDVLWTEPPAKDHPLFQMDNVVLTPHYASSTVEAMEDLAAKVSRQIVQYLRGEWPTYLANRALKEQPGCRLAKAGAAR